MTYQVILTTRAQADRDDAYQWYKANYSPQYAVKWYNGLHETLQSLSQNPTRCPLAPENDLLPFEVRQLLYGTRRKNHRALFTIYKDMVAVLYIRHTKQPPLTEEEL